MWLGLGINGTFRARRNKSYFDAHILDVSEDIHLMDVNGDNGFVSVDRKKSRKEEKHKKASDQEAMTSVVNGFSFHIRTLPAD